MTEEQEEFRQEMLRDSYEARSELFYEKDLYMDYDKFESHFSNEFEDAINSLKSLNKLFIRYGHDFDPRELL